MTAFMDACGEMHMWSEDFQYHYIETPIENPEFWEDKEFWEYRISGTP